MLTYKVEALTQARLVELMAEVLEILKPFVVQGLSVDDFAKGLERQQRLLITLPTERVAYVGRPEQAEAFRQAMPDAVVVVGDTPGSGGRALFAAALAVNGRRPPAGVGMKREDGGALQVTVEAPALEATIKQFIEDYHKAVTSG